MQAKAVKKYIRSSPRKMRLVVDMIRGKRASEAISILRFSTKLAARDAERVLQSAIANLNLKANENQVSIDDNEVVVKECFVNQGPAMKRILPAPMGRAYRIKKRSNHLTIVVGTPEAEEPEIENVREISESED